MYSWIVYANDCDRCSSLFDHYSQLRRNSDHYCLQNIYSPYTFELSAIRDKSHLHIASYLMYCTMQMRERGEGGGGEWEGKGEGEGGGVTRHTFPCPNV